MLSSRWRVNLKIFYSNGSFVKISGSFRELLSGRAAKLSARAKFFRPGHVLNLLWNVDTIKAIFQRKKNVFDLNGSFAKILALSVNYCLAELRNWARAPNFSAQATCWACAEMLTLITRPHVKDPSSSFLSFSMIISTMISNGFSFANQKITHAHPLKRSNPEIL